MAEKKSKPVEIKTKPIYASVEDFIINYDLKYRMGKELENGEEE